MRKNALYYMLFEEKWLPVINISGGMLQRNNWEIVKIYIPIHFSYMSFFLEDFKKYVSLAWVYIKVEGQYIFLSNKAIIDFQIINDLCIEHDLSSVSTKFKKRKETQVIAYLHEADIFISNEINRFDSIVKNKVILKNYWKAKFNLLFEDIALPNFK
ncbi:MAG: hypothetical protein ACOCQR_01235 [bacterium]